MARIVTMAVAMAKNCSLLPTCCLLLSWKYLFRYWICQRPISSTVHIITSSTQSNLPLVLSLVACHSQRIRSAQGAL